jgi:hypothetical protein
MRAFVVHDRKGNIAGLAVCPREGPPLYPTPEPTQIVTEVEFPDDAIDFNDEIRAIETLREFRVELKTEAKLVRKTSADAG